MEFASRSVPDLLRLTRNQPFWPRETALWGHQARPGSCPPSWPRPGPASSTFTDLIPSAQAHRVPPEALLSCQHFLHSSADIPASRVCVRNAVLGASPARAGALQHRAAAPALPAGPTSRISFSLFQLCRGRARPPKDWGWGPERGPN